MNLKEAYDKIDNTLCLNSQKLEFNIENEGIDCKDVHEMIDCLDTLDDAVQAIAIIKDYVFPYHPMGDEAEPNYYCLYLGENEEVEITEEQYELLKRVFMTIELKKNN